MELARTAFLSLLLVILLLAREAVSKRCTMSPSHEMIVQNINACYSSLPRVTGNNINDVSYAAACAARSKSKEIYEKYEMCLDLGSHKFVQAMKQCEIAYEKYYGLSPFSLFAKPGLLLKDYVCVGQKIKGNKGLNLVKDQAVVACWVAVANEHCYGNQKWKQEHQVGWNQWNRKDESTVDDKGPTRDIPDDGWSLYDGGWRYPQSRWHIENNEWDIWPNFDDDTFDESGWNGYLPDEDDDSLRNNNGDKIVIKGASTSASSKAVSSASDGGGATAAAGATASGSSGDHISGNDGILHASDGGVNSDKKSKHKYYGWPNPGGYYWGGWPAFGGYWDIDGVQDNYGWKTHHGHTGSSGGKDVGKIWDLDKKKVTVGHGHSSATADATASSTSDHDGELASALAGSTSTASGDNVVIGDGTKIGLDKGKRDKKLGAWKLDFRDSDRDHHHGPFGANLHRGLDSSYDIGSNLKEHHGHVDGSEEWFDKTLDTDKTEIAVDDGLSSALAGAAASSTSDSNDKHTKAGAMSSASGDTVVINDGNVRHIPKLDSGIGKMYKHQSDRNIDIGDSDADYHRRGAHGQRIHHEFDSTDEIRDIFGTDEKGTYTIETRNSPGKTHETIMISKGNKDGGARAAAVAVSTAGANAKE